MKPTDIIIMQADFIWTHKTAEKESENKGPHLALCSFVWTLAWRGAAPDAVAGPPAAAPGLCSSSLHPGSSAGGPGPLHGLFHSYPRACSLLQPQPQKTWLYSRATRQLWHLKGRVQFYVSYITKCIETVGLYSKWAPKTLAVTGGGSKWAHTGL